MIYDSLLREPDSSGYFHYRNQINAAGTYFCAERNKKNTSDAKLIFSSNWRTAIDIC